MQADLCIFNMYGPFVSTLSFSLLICCWPEEEGRLCVATIAQGLRNHGVQNVYQQEDLLAVSGHSVGEWSPCVKRRTDVGELGL